MMCLSSTKNMGVKNKNKDAFLKRRKENGLCINCGKPLDRDGTSCKSCREKINKKRREERLFYIKMGVCPVCRKNSLFGSEKLCKECAAKNAEQSAIYREKNKSKYLESHKKYNKNLYHSRKEAGICVRCGKRPARKGRTTCEMCGKKDAELHREIHNRIKKDKIPRIERPDHGMCYICGDKIQSGKICEKCKKQCTKNILSSSGNKYWRNDNKVVYAKWR